MPAPEILDVPPGEAVDFFRAKGYAVGFDWRDVEAAEHARAFSVAKAMRMDVLGDVRAEVDRAIIEGSSLADFQDALEPLLRKRGWWGRAEMKDPLTGKTRVVQLGSSHRLRVIYETNLRTSYAAGRWRRIQAEKQNAPWLRYSAVLDASTRPAHASWHGVVLPVNDPFWRTHYPPNGWGCRCTVMQLSDADLEEFGFAPSERRPSRRKSARVNSRTGEVVRVPEGIDSGWDHNVGAQAGGAPAGVVKDPLERAISRMDAAPDLAPAVAQDFIEGEGGRAFGLHLAGKSAGDWPVAALGDDIARTMGIKSRAVRLSAETAAKQSKRHPDLGAKDYARVQRMLNEGRAFQAADSDRALIAFLEEDKKLWRASVRASEDGRTTHLTSLRRAAADELEAAERELAEIVDGKLVRKGAIPELDAAVALERRISGPKGSNPGGLYRGADGVERYVKQYDDPAQAYSEAAANRIYRELGLEAPTSALVREGKKLSIASEIVENTGTLGKNRLTKAHANKVLDGFAADVWLANWDAVGLKLDNVVIAGKKVVRIDQGGSLLFRARAGRKPLDRLHKIAEWDGFSNPSINPAYVRIFEKADLIDADELGRRALRQMEDIKKLGERTNDFADLVPAVKGVPKADRDAILDLLRRRARLLENEIAPRVRKAMEALKNVPAPHRNFKKQMGRKFRSFLSAARGRMPDGQRHGLSDIEMAARYAYTTSDSKWGYGPLNDALRSRDQKKIAAVRDYEKTLKDALAKLPDYAGEVKRGTTLPDDVLDGIEKGGIFEERGFFSTSHSGEAAFGGPHEFVVQSRHGKRINGASAFPGEREVLFTSGTRFEVKGLSPKDGAIKNLHEGDRLMAVEIMEPTSPSRRTNSRQYRDGDETGSHVWARA